MLRSRKPYFNGRPVRVRLPVTCGRCETPFHVVLKRGRDHPRFVCPKCKMENLLQITWR